MLYFSQMKTSIRALLFDFDGLILDTETPEVTVWARIYAEYGFESPRQMLEQRVGLWGNAEFDPVERLHRLTHDSLDREALRQRHRDESAVLIEQQPIGAGVEDYLAAARRLGLRVGVASSSPRKWIEAHFARLGLSGRFDCIVTYDDVAPDRVKPNPDIYLKALECVGVAAPQAIAFEDSPPGLAAARAAGIFTVAVPNPTTASLDFGGANLVLTSLATLPLDDLLKRVGA